MIVTNIYMIVACGGSYSDYTETVKGVFSNENSAINFANEYATHTRPAYYVETYLELRIYPVDQVTRPWSKAEQVAEGLLSNNFKPLYEADDSSETWVKRAYR